jgi:ketosteroid isomerase-like protein
MTEKTELVARIYDAMAARDLDSLVQMLDPAVTVWQTEELPWGGSYEGTDGFAEFAIKLVSTITSAVEIERLYEAGDHVVQAGRTRGTVNATGVEFDIAETHIWDVRDGKAMSMRAYIDTPAMLEALDSPAP